MDIRFDEIADYTTSQMGGSTSVRLFGAAIQAQSPSSSTLLKVARIVSPFAPGSYDPS